MKSAPIITKVEAIHYSHTVKDLGTDYNTFNTVFEPGGNHTLNDSILRIHTDKGIIGEYPDVAGPALAEINAISPYLIGKEALSREIIYNDLKRGSRHWAKLGLRVIDICLWDIAGKFYDEPLFRLLGGERRPLKAYASTLHGDENGLISIPLDIADGVIKQAQIVRNDEEDYFRFVDPKDLTLEELKKRLTIH